MPTTSVDGWDAAIAGVIHISNAVENGLEGVIKDVAEIVVDKAQMLAPVRSGALRASIMVLDTAEDYAIVGALAPYAGFVEFGTSRMGAQPFMRPALAFVEQIFSKELFEAIEV